MTKAYAKLCCFLDCLQSPFLLAIRLYWGYHFIISGKGKLMHLERVTGFFGDLGIPFPHVNAMLAGTTECVGGLLLLVGLFSRLVSIPLAFVMCVAYATVHHDSLWTMETIIKQEPFTFLMVVMIVMIFGPGRFSVDYFLKTKFCKECVCRE